MIRPLRKVLTRPGSHPPVVASFDYSATQHTGVPGMPREMHLEPKRILLPAKRTITIFTDGDHWIERHAVHISRRQCFVYMDHCEQQPLERGDQRQLTRMPGSSPH